MSPLGPGWDHCHPCIHPFRVTTLGIFFGRFYNNLGRPSLQRWILGSFCLAHFDLQLGVRLAHDLALTSGGNQYGPGPLQRQENATWFFCAQHNSNFPAVIVCLDEKHFQDLIGCQISLKFKVVRIECITDSQWAMNLFASWSYEHHNPPGACHGAFTTCFSHES